MTSATVQDSVETGLQILNRMPVQQARDYLRTSLGVNVVQWAEALAGRRPFASVDDLVAGAVIEIDKLDEEQIARSHDGLARLGVPKIGDDSETRWSRTESAGISRTPEFLAELNAAHDAYEAKFGHIFLANATGLTGEQILEAIKRRTRLDRAAEYDIIRRELAGFLAVRTPKILHELAQPGRSQ